MSMKESSTALTEGQRSLLQVSLEIARDKFRDHVKELQSPLPPWSSIPRLATQFDKQAKEADELLMRIINAKNIIIEEEKD